MIKIIFTPCAGGMEIIMKKTKILALMLVLCALLGMASCEKRDESIPDGYQLAASEDSAGAKEYYFYVPASWSVAIDNTATSATVSASDPASVSVMTWTPAVSDSTPGDFWKSFVSDFEKVYSDFAIEKEEDMLLDGVAARSVTFTGALGGVSYRFCQVTAVKDSLVYVLTYTNLADRFDEHDGDFAEIVGYFKFK